MNHWSSEQCGQQVSEMLRNKGIICKNFFNTGSCPRNTNCPYIHIKNGEARPTPWIACMFFNNGVCLRDRCAYFHGSQSQLDRLRASGASMYHPQDYMQVAEPPKQFLAPDGSLAHRSPPLQPLASVQPTMPTSQASLSLSSSTSGARPVVLSPMLALEKPLSTLEGGVARWPKGECGGGGGGAGDYGEFLMHPPPVGRATIPSIHYHCLPGFFPPLAAPCTAAVMPMEAYPLPPIRPIFQPVNSFFLPF
ncbi:unnamed protein product [Phytomonas sp. EM1]|nr:unnamed protein product [Phytomonas sp. EM1]|eukprot:CCW64409.1 unnamed protein product [Phytomonas sp. isolate EM1]